MLRETIYLKQAALQMHLNNNKRKAQCLTNQLATYLQEWIWEPVSTKRWWYQRQTQSGQPTSQSDFFKMKFHWRVKQKWIRDGKPKKYNV
jgi:hypothetical protein